MHVVTPSTNRDSQEFHLDFLFVFSPKRAFARVHNRTRRTISAQARVSSIGFQLVSSSLGGYWCNVFHNDSMPAFVERLLSDSYGEYSARRKVNF